MEQRVAQLTRFVFTILFLLLLISCQKGGHNIDFIETEPPILVSNTIRINDVIGGFYSALPTHYGETSKQYPLLIFIHGGGQVGDGNTELPKVLFQGVPELLKNKEFPPRFKVKGEYYSFIVLAPQFARYPSDEEVESFIIYACNNYRIDKKRIYISGLSMGGIISSDMGAKYTSQIAAIVPISGVSSFADSKITEKCKNIALGKLPVWVFQNDEDMIANVDAAKNYVSLINSFSPIVISKYTQFLPWGISNHDAWTRATDPHYKENNMNIYEWMLQYTR